MNCSLVSGCFALHDAVEDECDVCCRAVDDLQNEMLWRMRAGDTTFGVKTHSTNTLFACVQYVRDSYGQQMPVQGHKQGVHVTKAGKSL